MFVHKLLHEHKNTNLSLDIFLVLAMLPNLCILLFLTPPPPPSSKAVFKDIEIYLRITQFIFNTFNQIDFMTFCDFFHYIVGCFFLNCHTDKSFLLSPPTIQNFDIWCISPLSYLCISLMNEMNLNTFNVIHKYAFYLHSRNKITNMNEHKKHNN